MLNAAEQKLLNSNLSKFPMIMAASAAIKQCHKCGHGKVNVRALLHTAVAKYKSNPDFIKHCKTLFRLPCMVGGFIIQE